MTAKPDTAFACEWVTLTASPRYIKADGISTSILMAKIANAYGAPVGGYRVYFSIYQGTGTIYPPSAVTDSSGIATSTYTSSTVPRQVWIKAQTTVQIPKERGGGTKTVTDWEDVWLVKVEITNPTEGQDFDYTAASNYLAHDDISFRALIQPTSVTGIINWQLKLTDPESGEINNKTFTSNSGETDNFSYSNWGGSWGGNLLVNASTTINSNLFQATPVNATITGIAIPNSTISAAFGNDLFRAVCWQESNYRQFTTQGWPLRSGNDRGLMQINGPQWGNIREYAWNWQSNINKGISILNANYGQSVQHASNLGHSMTDYQHWNNALSLYNTGGYYYVWDDTTNQWVPNPNNQTGVAYADSVRNLEATKPWQ